MLACDVQTRLILFLGGEGGSTGAIEAARTAIIDCHREWPTLHHWKYFNAIVRVNLRGSFNAGTISYNAATKQVVLSGASWPSWAALGSIRVNELVARVVSVQDAATLTVDAGLDLGAANLAPGTGYILYQDRYPLPLDFLANDTLYAENRFGSLGYTDPGTWEWATRSAERQGPARFYTFFPSATIPGGYDLLIWPFPDSDTTLEGVRRRRMRPLNYIAESQGKVTTTAGSPVVTGRDTRFRADMAGATIRVSVDGNPPSGPEGTNRPAFEAVVLSVQGQSSLTLTAPAPASQNSCAYVVSDVLDVDDQAMATAFQWRCQMHLAANKRMKDAAQIGQRAAEFLLLAKDADAPNYSMQVAGVAVAGRRQRKYLPQGPDEP